MTFLDLLFRARRPASMVAFNNALPTNFKLFVRNDDDTAWIAAPGVSIVTEGLNPLVLYAGTPEVGVDPASWADPPVYSPDYHVNMRVEDPIYSRVLLDPGDPDSDLDKNKIRRWLRNNGAERLDASGEHPRSGATTGWWRWTDGTEWVDIIKAKPGMRRGIWFGDDANPDL